MPPDREPPVVTVTGGPNGQVRRTGRGTADDEPSPDQAALPGRSPALALLAVLAAGAVVLGVAAAPDPPEPPAPVDAELALVAGELSNSQSGVLVLPVDIVNRGPAVDVAESTVWAEPTRSTPAVSGTSRVEAGGTGRLVVLLQPDCRLLGPTSSTVVAATLDVRVVADTGSDAGLVLDLGGQPALVERVADLCRRPADGSTPVELIPD